MRVISTVLAFLITLTLVSATAFFCVLLLAGPHGGLLPAPLHNAALALGWVCVAVVPVLVARRVWRR